jgi:hypothetical protein
MADHPRDLQSRRSWVYFYCPRCLTSTGSSSGSSLRLKWLNPVPLSPTTILATTNPHRFQLTLPPGFSITASPFNSRFFPHLSFQVSPHAFFTFHESGFSARFSTPDNAHRLEIYPSAVRIATRVPASRFPSRFDAVIGSDGSVAARFGDVSNIGCSTSFRGGRPSRCSMFVEVVQRPIISALEIAYGPEDLLPFSVMSSYGFVSDRTKVAMTVAAELIGENVSVFRCGIGGRWRRKMTIASVFLSAFISPVQPCGLDWRVGWDCLIRKGTRVLVGKLQNAVVVSAKKKFVSGMVVKPSVAIGKHIGLRLSVVQPSPRLNGPFEIL